MLEVVIATATDNYHEKQGQNLLQIEILNFVFRLNQSPVIALS